MPDRDTQTLDEWRIDFLDLAAQEGARRFGARWSSMSSTWRKSNRRRPLSRLSPLDPTPDVADKLRAAFLKDIADRARRAWGPLWDEHRDAWAAASAAQQDPTSAWDSSPGLRTEDLGAQAIAEALVSAIPRSPRRPGQELLVLNRLPLARERLAAVQAALAESGVAGLVQVPRPVAIQEGPSSLLLGSDSVTGRALEELAGSAIELLSGAAPGTRD